MSLPGNMEKKKEGYRQMKDYIVRATAAHTQIRAFAASTTEMVEEEGEDTGRALSPQPLWAAC